MAVFTSFSFSNKCIFSLLEEKTLHCLLLCWYYDTDVIRNDCTKWLSKFYFRKVERTCSCSLHFLHSSCLNEEKDELYFKFNKLTDSSVFYKHTGERNLHSQLIFERRQLIFERRFGNLRYSEADFC